MTTLAPRPPAAQEADGGRPVPHHRVIVIGAGFAGIGAAIRLRQLGIDVVVLERAGDIGGTWRDNTYPGCQCDVPSFLYSFSFAPHPGWTRAYALQPEIQDYLLQVVDQYDVRPCIRFHHEVLDARWLPGEQHWAVRTTGGDLTADVLVAAQGGLSNPSIPDLPGLGSFRGTVFHSAAWNHGHDLSGERVAVIGTGASAVQLVPHVQRTAGHLSVFQRTPGWVLPHPDGPIPPSRQALYERVPALQQAIRGIQYASREAMVVMLVKRPGLTGIIEKAARGHLARQVPDPDLRARLTPTYSPGCKRLLMSNVYYPALTHPNVDVVTTGIREIGPGGITTDDGIEHELDTIILATGFTATDPPIAGLVHGLGGASLHDAWSTGQRAYLGMSVPRFPNLFLLMGPNTALGHTSVVYMLESGINYLASALEQMDHLGIGAFDVTTSAADGFTWEMQARLAGSVWNTGGCRSWYLDAEGRNNLMWPGFTFEYRHRTRHFDPSRYHVVTRQPAPATV